MKSVIVLQARTNSSRLPAKVLLPVHDMPLVILAAKRASNTGREIIIATSEEPSDDELASVIKRHGFSCFRGSLKDTLDRTVAALASFDDDVLVFRLTADNIFPDGRLLDEIEKDFLNRDLDYLCCNGEASGLPYGVSAELTILRHLREASISAVLPYDREHVTPYVVRKFGATNFEYSKLKGLGRYRCTVDCFDDYLNILKVFDGVENPTMVGILELLDKLSSMDFQPISEIAASKLVFGSAQLGLQYGVANSTGLPSLEYSENLIKTGIANGIEFLDTARAYGNSEEVIGTALTGGWDTRVKVITKLSPLEECPKMAAPEIVKAFVDASVYQSCSALRTRYLDVLMMHRASHLLDWNGAVYKRILELRDLGVIAEIGVSVQTPEELSSALGNSDVSFIQMPFNILDWRWDAVISQIELTKLKRKLTIHVRSALLQGLLSSKNEEHWKRARVENYTQVLAWLDGKVASLGFSSVVELCLSFAKSFSWIDGVVVGMETSEQLAENIRLFGTPSLPSTVFERLLLDRPLIEGVSLNPAYWNEA